VSHIPNPLVAGDPIIDLVVCLTAGTAAEDILREIKGEAFGRTSTVCNCSPGHTLPIYVSGRTINPGADNPLGESWWTETQEIAEGMLGQQWPAVEAVAVALIECGELDGARVAKLIRDVG
jgi:hypothetical protein